MPTYEYYIESGTEGWKLAYLQGKLFDFFNSTPTELTWYAGMSMSSNEVMIHTSRDLTAEEKNTLDAFIAGADGLRPVNAGYTLVEIPDFIRNWKTIEDVSKLEIRFCFINEETQKIEMWINGDVSTTKRNDLKNTLTSLISITKY